MKTTKRITISDIAGLAGVSKATTSLVLNGRSKEYRVADGTRDRILANAAASVLRCHAGRLNRCP